MRSIVFRSKRADTGTWVYGDLLHVGYLYCIGETIDASFNGCFVNPETVGQNTGLIDNDGKEIYEGDLLLFNGKVCEVVYDKNLASFVLYIGYKRERGSKPLGEMLRSFDFKIIGNIHDNPELLEGEGS